MRYDKMSHVFVVASYLYRDNIAFCHLASARVEASLPVFCSLPSHPEGHLNGFQ